MTNMSQEIFRVQVFIVEISPSRSRRNRSSLVASNRSAFAGSVRGNFRWQDNRCFCAGTQLAFHCCGPTMRFHDRSDKTKPKAKASLGTTLVAAKKAIPNAREIFGGNTSASVSEMDLNRVAQLLGGNADTTSG